MTVKTASAWTLVLSLHLGQHAVSVQRSGDSVKRFEVASIRRNTRAEELRQAPGRRVAQSPHPTTLQPGGVLRSDGATLRELARDAYDFDYRADAELLGGEPWMAQERYDIVAKADVSWPTSNSLRLPVVAQQLLRQLLTDRFKLAAHIEPRRRPIYRMVLAKTDQRLGVDLKPAPKPECQPVLAPATPLKVLGQPGTSRSPCLLTLASNFFVARSITMMDFATFLATLPDVNATVVDETGLAGSYDIRVTYRPSSDLGTTGNLEDRPLLVDALAEQLGLKLIKAEGEVNVMIIDSAQRPSAN